MNTKNLYKIAIESFALAVCVLLIFSCVSFDVVDAPAGWYSPANGTEAGEQITNWCGQIGAFLAYYSMKFIGPGIFVLLITSAWGLIVGLSGKRVTQPILRIVGLFLIVTAMSCTWYLLWESKNIWPYTGGSIPNGNGGVLGIAAGEFLKGYFANTGTTIVVLSAWIVGAVLLADVIVLWIVRMFGVAVGKMLGGVVPAWAATKNQTQSLGSIWKRLSEKQKAQTKKRGLFSKKKDMEIEKLAGIDDEYEYVYEDEIEEDGDETHEEPSEEKQGKVKKKSKMSVTMPKVKKPKAYVPKTYDDYLLPPIELLTEPEYGFASVQEKMVEDKAQMLEGLLDEFGINAHVVNAEPGPAITMYELELARGVKVSQISNLANDMARALSAGSVRVVAPLPGKHTIGIEAPNTQREIVRIKELLTKSGQAPNKMKIPLFLGKSSSGESLVSDLSSMPHLLIAGTTGSGKSVCINSIITSILLTKRPDEVKLIMVDPKMVEMVAFDSIPHLMCPIVTDVPRAEQILDWATTKMDERYELLAEAKVRNIASYNKLGSEEIIKRFQPSTKEEEAKIPKKMPYVVIVIDELADLMMTSAKEVEAYIVRIAQKSRAVGIHLVVATQRPQATVVTGLIKSNMPARIGFRVASRMDSRIILDQNGAETLLGQGDMLFLKPGTSELVRSQGAFLDDEEIEKVVDHLKQVAEPQYHPELMQLNRIDTSGLSKDDLFEDAVKVVLETKRGSVSLLQRRLSIGYARASRIIEMMAASGILGEYKGSQAREVVMTAGDWDNVKRQMTEDEVAGYADLAAADQTEDIDDDEEYEEAATYADEGEDDDDEEYEENDE